MKHTVLNAIKVVLINLLVLLLPLFFLDAWFLYGKLDYRTRQGVTCKAVLTNYDYCPSIVHMNYMSLSDKWLPVVNYIGEDRRSRYKSAPDFPSNGHRVFLIGDSFIQADEIRIEDRFETRLREAGYEVAAFGYSSWNSRQFLSIVQSLSLREGDRVYIFSMTNDYTPHYRSATINTVLNVTRDESAGEDTRSLVHRILDNSPVINTLRRLWQSLAASTKGAGEKELSVRKSHTITNWMDCDSLPPTGSVASPLVHDYLVLSKHESCWPRQIQESVELNIRLLREANRLIRSQGARLTIALIPAGWAFPNQNTLGRNHSLYRIPVGISVGQAGLSDKLAHSGLDLIDLEKVLVRYVGRGDDYLYFPADGHFTENTHRILGDYLLRELRQSVSK